jgi:RHS repeat-associated protein
MSPSAPNAWLGGLIDEQRDPSGLLYRRNRYLDPSTGRFTQEDPIGLGGGSNLYGYANGDPVNYSDPLGLYAETMGGEPSDSVDGKDDPCAENEESNECKARRANDEAKAAAAKHLACEAATQNALLAGFGDLLALNGGAGATRAMQAQRAAASRASVNAAARGYRQALREHGPASAGNAVQMAGGLAMNYSAAESFVELIPVANLFMKVVKQAGACF